MKRLLWLVLGLFPLVAVADPCALVIDKDQSKVEVVVGATFHSFTAILCDYTTAVTVDPGAAHVQSAVFTFHFSDIKTGRDSRDARMLEWQEADKNPDGVFTLIKVDSSTNGHFVAHGTLRFHGTIRKITFPLAVMRDGRLYAIDGVASFDTRDFGLLVLRKFGLFTVNPVVKVRFHLQGMVVTNTSNPS